MLQLKNKRDFEVYIEALTDRRNKLDEEIQRYKWVMANKDEFGYE